MEVKLAGLQGNPELNGTPGVIVDYHEEKKRFMVKVGEKTLLLRPSNLSKP